MTRVCVIGGGGFIGSHLVGALLAAGREVTVVGRRQASSRSLPDGVRYLSGDYGDPAFQQALFEEGNEIVHLAYATVPQTSFADPVRDITANLPQSVQLFAEASRRKVAKLVFVSSGGAVYGKANALPVAEDHPTTPISPYGITKLALEKYALMYHELKGLPVVIVRPGNAYGPNQMPFGGQGFVATAIASILKGQEIALFGEAGTVRDYLHVRDVAAGIACALTRGSAGSCYNIGSGMGRSNLDIIDALAPLAARIKLAARLRILPARRFDVPASVLNCGKLIKDTGWRARIPLAEGIAETWDWYCRAHDNRVEPGSGT